MAVKNRKWLLLVALLAIIGFLVISFYNIFEPPPQVLPAVSRNEYRQIPVHRLWMSPLLLVVAIIPLSYYFIARRFEEKLERNVRLISRLINQSSLKPKSLMDVNKDAVLKLLNFNERKVLMKLVEKKGEALQSEITRMEGMDKLKTHRAIRNLEIKGVIRAENYGKTKRIILSKDIKSMILR